MNTEETRKIIEAYGIVPMKADKTRPSPEVDEMLELLGNKGRSIPFYAIFPADRPDEPILLDGVFLSPTPIVEALKKAGPSRDLGLETASRGSGEE
ncbi:MAG: hypothetical protein GXP27_21725 [Planctomycetes bacterium]|nr:hypothetical protein [Planctomycetota bacterium]